MRKKGIQVITRNILQLSKVKITIAVSFTTITGYVLARGEFDAGFLWVTLGIFLLACGASVLNHIQEYRTDAVMNRTKNRPIPSGKISREGAFIIFLVEFLAGVAILYYKVNIGALLLGLLAWVWYNFVYTYLKRVTSHAVIPGSLIGAIPPLVGWVAAGASISDPRAWAMALFFFVWQVPHFYLLVMKYGEQYKKAGIPSLTESYSEQTIRLMIFLWIVTTALSALLLFYFGLLRSLSGLVVVLAASLWLVVVFFIPLIRKKKEFLPFSYFMRINYYVLFIIVILNIDHLLYEYFV